MPNYYGNVIYSDELYHYGRSKRDGAKRGSGRYPLGSGDRPNQRWVAFGSKSRAGEKSEADKQRAIKSGTARDVLRYKGELTNKELQDAVNRLRLEKQLEEINHETINKGKRTAAQFLGKIGERVLVPIIVGTSAWFVQREIGKFLDRKLTDMGLDEEAEEAMKKEFDELKNKMFNNGKKNKK